MSYLLAGPHLFVWNTFLRITAVFRRDRIKKKKMTNFFYLSPILYFGGKKIKRSIMVHKTIKRRGKKFAQIKQSTIRISTQSTLFHSVIHDRFWFRFRLHKRETERARREKNGWDLTNTDDRLVFFLRGEKKEKEKPPLENAFYLPSIFFFPREKGEGKKM